MFKSLIDLTKDVVEIASTPVEVAVDATRAVTKPVAEAMKEVKDDIKKELDVD